MAKPKIDFPEVRALSQFMAVESHVFFRDDRCAVPPRSFASASVRQRGAAAKKPRLSLDQLLAGYDPQKHGGELMAFEPVGREKL